MHFWIDKRSQAYGFGRARVAASLSGAGGNGLGFAHPPRRMGGKTTLMPTLHRLPTQHHNHSHPQQQQPPPPPQQQQQQQQSTIIDCHRSHSINNNNNNNNSSHNSNHHGHSNNNHHSNSNYNSGGSGGGNNNNSVANNNNFYSNISCSGTTVQHYSTSSSSSGAVPVVAGANASASAHNRINRSGCRSSTSINNVTSNNNNHEAASMGSTTRSYHHHPQFGNMSIRHHYQQSMTATGHADHTYSSRSQQQQHHHHHHHHNPVPRTHLAVNSGSVSLPSIYVSHSRSPSHGQNLEEGAMGMGPISTVRLRASNSTAATVTSATHSTTGNAMLDPTDTRVLPSHLKYGMWATLILASVLVAGAKFYADHQGTGLEVLIFAAFSATFFLAACTVSLCRLPGSLAASPSLSIDDSSRGLLNQQSNQLNLHYQPAQQQPSQQENLELTPTGAPPPYHIAILLPENDKDVQFKDESPPPSYDKIVI